ncbi:hypothetical protein N431DRAFT_107838 [Stipitochalara longipes BDJ]|nr:hypothetical protein N431DRAFT_107838 [Stipitochalara longipes BDJ]
MENGSAKKERHKHGKEIESQVQAKSQGIQDGDEHEGVRTKKKKKKHRDSSQKTASQDVDGMSIDLDAPQRYIPTPEHKRKCKELDSQEHSGIQVLELEHAVSTDQLDGNDGEAGNSAGTKTTKKRKRKSSETLERSVFEGVVAMIDAETLDLSLAKKKAEEKNPRHFKKQKQSIAAVELKELPGIRNKGSENARDNDKNEDDEGIRRKEEKRRRKEEKRATRKSLESLKSTNSKDRSQEAVKEEDTIIETPKKKCNRDKEAPREHHDISEVEENPCSDHQETPKSNSKKKRKLDHSAQSTPLLLNTIPVHRTKSFLTTIIKASPRMHMEDNAAETTPTPKSKKARKRFKESPLHLHTVPAHESPATPNPTYFDLGNNNVDKPSEKKRSKKKKAKVSKESALFHTVPAVFPLQRKQAKQLRQTTQVRAMMKRHQEPAVLKPPLRSGHQIIKPTCQPHHLLSVQRRISVMELERRLQFRHQRDWFKLRLEVPSLSQSSFDPRK